ncbi:MAG: DUF2203 domain-containing protein [Cyanobacteria bacterium NC_groundwater_1444_Ag_S-0.65um_54_12]|nr:DUF2203 domain-containing protein [Cyanobacteria bacterium NC_groundwater_1444_Ag_S-0.65um_54_12]
MLMEFALEEVNALIPQIRQLLLDGKTELAKLSANLKKANSILIEVELELRHQRLRSADVAIPFDDDPRWQAAAAEISACKTAFRERTQYWLDAIAETGAVLRDFTNGLVDFPGRLDDAAIFWCWHLGEAEIAHWHNRYEGFAHRKPLKLGPLH